MRDLDAAFHALVEDERPDHAQSGRRATVLVAGRLPAFVAGLALWLGARNIEADIAVVTGETQVVVRAIEVVRPAAAVPSADIDLIALVPALGQARLLALVPFESLAVEVDLLRSGAAGVIGANADEQALVGAVRDLLAGRSVASADAIRILAASAPGDCQLTARQREILGLLEDGLTMSQIAATLTLAPSTIKTHAQRIRARLGTPIPRGLHAPARLITPAHVDLRTTSASSETR